jgi:hypothetical protein
LLELHLSPTSAHPFLIYEIILLGKIIATTQ